MANKNISTLEEDVIALHKVNETFFNVCFSSPPSMEFGGNWDDVFKSPVLLVRASHLVPLLELQIVVIFVITQVTHHLFFKPFKLPKVISQIVTGILLGPSIKDKSGKESLFPFLSQDAIGTASVFGYAFFMFLTGVKMDAGMIKKTGHKALTIGILSLVVPIICGLLTAFACAYVFKEEEDDKVYFVAATHSLTSFAVVSSLLQDLKLLNSELGRLGLSSGLVSDMINVIATSTASFIRVFMGTGQPIYKIYRDIGSLIAYILAVVFIIRPALFWIVKHTPAGRPVKDVYIYAIFLMVLLSGILSDMFDQTVLLGPFILGLAVPDGPPLGAAIVKKFDCFFSGVFTPLFVTICAMKADLSSIGDDRKLLTLDIVLLVVTFLSKVMASFVPSLICKMPFNDSLAIGFVMSSKGVVELASYSLFHDYKTIDDQTFAVLLVSVLIIAILVPSMVNYLYDPSRKYAGYQKRNIIDMKPNAELRILACIHSQYDVAPVINLLDVSCPTGGSPISVNALHLIELVGRASPVFIAHHIHEKVTFNVHFSEKVIGPFNHIESDDNTRRALNSSVLERAPCSIGIIVHRGHVRHSSSLYSIAMIFLGGRDDREALTFAKRVTKDPGSFSLTVVRLDAEDGKTMNDWEKVLDNEVLKEFKQKSVANAHVKYIEETAKDAIQTTRILRSIMNEFELIIVGRRNGLDSPQTLGFSEWSEFPELGVIGDLLVSSDFDSNASIFVVQQQQQLKGTNGFEL
ncbi:PREDICTED: cation/H(+) antiporter [Prunus dulcis]|uniref:PREDICTED: cation/H(+) antiporter n=1 Tax=Prunus dulcis TaxID=3755 RepID=A0A5E4FW53_PRUDU|nr:PREDICTED: cation/H(+) antiporter [Prunus dulcis]